MPTIVVPIDSSAASEAALPVAEWLARGLGAEIVLVTVGPIPETTPQAEDARENLLDRLGWAAPRESGVIVRERAEFSNDRSQGIVDAVRAEHADLVVMAGHHISRDDVITGVLNAAVAPVTIVPVRE